MDRWRPLALPAASREAGLNRMDRLPQTQREGGGPRTEELGSKSESRKRGGGGGGGPEPKGLLLRRYARAHSQGGRACLLASDGAGQGQPGEPQEKRLGRVQPEASWLPAPGCEPPLLRDPQNRPGQGWDVETGS